MAELDPNTLAQLARKAQEGDAVALDGLLSNLYSKIYYTALKITGNASDAEDLTQDACLKLLDGLPQLQDPQAVLKWADTITRNTCMNHLKRNRPYLFQTDEEEQTALNDLPEEQTDAVPDRYMDMLAKREIILDMIDALPEKQRVAVYLYYYGAHCVEEIAQIMEVSEGTVKSRLSAARATIKLRVEEEERKGNKLYVIFPFLGRLLREDAQNTQPPAPLPVTSQQIAACAQQCAAVAAAAAASKAVGETAAKSAGETTAKSATETAAKSATKSAAAKGGTGLAVKVVAGVVVVALLVGAGIVLPGLLRGGEATPSGVVEIPAPSAETTAEVTPEATPEPTPEPTLNPTDFDPEAMIGQPLSAMVAIAGEPTEQDDPLRPRWVSGMDYDFTVTLADDGDTIRELFVLYGPSVLGLNAGDSADAARDALSALGDPAGVGTIDTGYGQTSYSAISADGSRLYQFDCVNGTVLMRSIHNLNG